MFFDLEREGTVVELEYDEHGQLVAYPIGDEDADDEASEWLFSIPASTPEAARSEFQKHGWV